MKKNTAIFIMILLLISAYKTLAQDITITHAPSNKMMLSEGTPKGTLVKILIRIDKNGLVNSIDSQNEKYLAFNRKYIELSQGRCEINASLSDQNNPNFRETLRIKWSDEAIDYDISYSPLFSQSGHLSVGENNSTISDANFSFSLTPRSLSIHQVYYNGYGDLKYDGKATHYFYKDYDNFHYTYEWGKQSVYITSFYNYPGTGWTSGFPKVSVAYDSIQSQKNMRW